MDSTERESGKDKINPARRYIRLQEIGMSCWLSWSPAMMLADMYDVQRIIPAMSVLLLSIGTVIFAIGHEGRRELRAKEDINE